MNDREPDDLYDALRDRLADYGQEPTAPLWANIRAQLPSPVAAPYLRRRARRRRLAALAVLLLLFVSVGTWQWRRAGERQPALARHSVIKASNNNSGPVANAPDGLPTEKGSQLATRASNNTPQQASTDVLSQPVAATGGIANDLSTKFKISEATKAKPAGETTVASATKLPGTVALGHASRRRVPAAARSARFGAGMAAQEIHKSGTDTLVLTASAASISNAARPAFARRNRLVAAQLPASVGKTVSRRENMGSAAGQPAALLAGQHEPDKPLAGTPGVTILETPQWTTGSARGTGETWPPTIPRATALLLPVSGASARLARADTLPPLPVAAVRRWAVQALAGPALTSRTLGSAQRSGTFVLPPTSPTTSPTSTPTRSATRTILLENERSATGFGAELQVQRQLNGRWSLNTGLGYQSFATTQTANVRVVYGPPVASSFRPDSVGASSVRSTDYFLTLPLRVGYQLGAGPGRLRYGLRAGADVAFYLGSRSTEGSTSGSITGADTSPYRSLSLALSLGAEVRYQFAPGWEVLAQPTLTRFATSAVRPASGYEARYPLGATVLVGVAYWLH